MTDVPRETSTEPRSPRVRCLVASGYSLADVSHRSRDLHLTTRFQAPCGYEQPRGARHVVVVRPASHQPRSPEGVWQTEVARLHLRLRRPVQWPGTPRGVWRVVVRCGSETEIRVMFHVKQPLSREHTDLTRRVCNQAELIEHIRIPPIPVWRF